MKFVHNIHKLVFRRKELRNKCTPEEALLWQNLRNSKLGAKFRRQHSVGGYIADFYCPSQKLAIELDGAGHFQKEEKEYDRIRDAYFIHYNIIVLRFPNSEISGNIKSVLQKITANMRNENPA